MTDRFSFYNPQQYASALKLHYSLKNDHSNAFKEPQV